MNGQKILLMGQTGYGKTSLVLRLLYDWSSQDATNGYLSHWKFVFFLPCRDYAVHRNLLALSKEELDLGVSITVEIESQTLFLIDGLDELSNDWPTDVVELLDGKLYPNSTVLATSRPLPSVVGCPSFNKRVVIHGLEETQIQVFIRSYFGASTEGCDTMMAILQTNARLIKLASNPLMCVLLCLAFEGENGWLPDSPAELFALLMRFVMAHCLQQQVNHLNALQVFCDVNILRY